VKLDSPEACMLALAGHLSRADLDGVSALFDERATFVDDDGQLARGRAEIRATLAPFFTGGAKLELEIQRVIPIGDDLAVVYHEWHSEIPDADGDVVPNAGTSVQVLRRRADGSWRIVFDDPNRPLDDR